MTAELVNIRTKVWERKFPGCSAEFQEIFGKVLPTVAEVAEWKQHWCDTAAHCLILEVNGGGINPTFNNVERSLDACGIHPYYYSLCYSLDTGLHRGLFYSGEHLVMFKLAWQ